MPRRPLTLCWIKTFAMALMLIVSPSWAGISAAEEGEPSELAPAITPAQSTEPAPGDTNSSEKPTAMGKAMDVTHESIERNILNQAVRLDKFFGNAKSEHQQNTNYELRWRNSLRVEKGGDLEFGTTAMANIVLSRINERLRLIIAGGDEPEPVAPRLPEDPGNPGFDRTFQAARLVNTEVRYGLVKTPSTDVFLGAGVRLALPLEVFARSRIQYTYTISDVSLVRFVETPFIKSIDGLGQTTEVDLEQSLTPKTLLRWANLGTISHEIKGVEWGTELSLLRELSSVSAISATGGVYGNTSIGDWVSNYRILTRYRQNFLRSWLFYEIEPELSWPRSANGHFPTNFSITFRLEVLFQGTDTGKAAKAGVP